MCYHHFLLQVCELGKPIILISPKAVLDFFFSFLLLTFQFETGWCDKKVCERRSVIALITSIPLVCVYQI